MAHYTFLNTKTNEEFDIVMSMSELDPYKEANPHLQQLIKRAPALADPTRIGRMKPDDGFRDILRNVKKSHKGSTVNTW